MTSERESKVDFHRERDAHYERLINSARIMMVDDEPINMEVLQLHLESEGYNNFISTSDSREAVELTRSSQPDVLLLDLMMPLVSGFDILQELRSDPDLWQTPVIVLTSSDDPETKLKALRLGANDFLSKPVDASELALRLRNTLAAQAFQHQLEHFDSLTGLPNRKLLDKKLKQIIKIEPADDNMFALLLVNLDRFKNINDSLGRKTGSEVLHAVARSMQLLFGGDPHETESSTEENANTVFRMGGDKFVVLMPLQVDAQEAVVQAGPFLKRMEEPFDVFGEEIYVSCSVGISLFPGDGQDEESLLSHAETAMVHAKQSRTNSYAFYAQEMDVKARQLLGLENGLRTALENNELFLTFQPKVCTRTGIITSAEALLRWQHPELGLISPERFIPMAEDNGLIVPIGDWVLQQACQQVASWRSNIMSNFRISVNLSIRQMYEDGFIESVKNALQVSSLPADALTLELTENMMMEKASSNVAKLDELKKIGVKISIDDFGTGYSSLSYLQKFPLDELKIDKSFIQTIESPLDKAPIVRAVVSLAHDLGMKIVAEGVETRHQLAHVRALRCEEFQGYLCSKPLKAAEFETLLSDAHLRKAG